MGGALVFHALRILDQQGNAFEGAWLEAAFRIELFSQFCLGEGFIEIAVGEAIFLFSFPLRAINALRSSTGEALRALKSFKSSVAEA
jgi:hypothetical protein